MSWVHTPAVMDIGSLTTKPDPSSFCVSVYLAMYYLLRVVAVRIRNKYGKLSELMRDDSSK